MPLAVPSEHFITVSGQLLLHWDSGADNGEKYTPEHLRDEHGGDVAMESKDPPPVLEAASEEMALMRLEARIQTEDGSSMCLTHLKNVQCDCDMCQVRRKLVAAAKDSIGINKGIAHETKVVYRYLDYNRKRYPHDQARPRQYGLASRIRGSSYGDQ